MRCPKWAAANRPTKPSMQKPLMALSQRPRQVEGSHPITSRHDLAVLVDGEDTGPERLAGAAREDAEVVRILKVFREHDITGVEEGRELGDREVPYPPGVLILVGNAGVEDEAPPRRGGLVHCPQRLDEEG